MMAGKCPHAEVISRAFPDDASAELRAHLAECQTCRAEWDALARLRQLGRELPVELPDADRRDAVRAKLLYRAERRRADAPSDPAVALRAGTAAPQRRLRRVWGLLAVAAGVALLWASWGALRGHGDLLARVDSADRPDAYADGKSAGAHAHRASITMLDAARYTHQGGSAGETVRLYEGTVQLSVLPLPAGERFRVVVGDGEVEVRGTIFTVAAAADQLRSVTVQRGVVEVRTRGQGSVVLQAGDSWRSALPAPSRGDAVGSSGGASTRSANPAPAPVNSSAAPASREGASAQAQARPAVDSRACTGDCSAPSAGGAAANAALDRRLSHPAAHGSPATGSHAAAAAATPRTAGAGGEKGATGAGPAPTGERSPQRGAEGAGAASRATGPVVAAVSVSGAVASNVAAPSSTAGTRPAPGAPAERAFSAGFLSLKQGRFAAAAEQLEQALALAPTGAVAEDARFWLGVAWARAGRSREATTSMRAFLSAYPQSPRAAEVSAALGWLLLRTGQMDDAERAFREAGRDRSPQVSESIRAGLAAVAQARARGGL